MEKVPTDQHKYGSTEVEYSEELLTQWHKWYSDSEDSDYEEDEDRDSLGGHRYVSDFSSSTSEDASSDEDYCGHSSYKPVRGERRGRGRRQCTTRDSTYHPAQPASPISNSPSPVPRLPPPLISNSEADLLEMPPPEAKVQRVVATSPPVKIVSPVKPAVPDLVPIKSVKCHGPVKPVVIGSSAHSTSSGLVQYYQVPGGVQSLMPIQLVQSSTYSAPPGSVIMLQPAGGGRPQRVSVIMNPRPPPSSSSTSYITQLDGSLPGHHLPTTSALLQDEFESMRKKAGNYLDTIYQQDQLVSHSNNVTRGAKRKAKAPAAAVKETSSSLPPPPPIGPPQKKKRKVGSSNGGEGGKEGEGSGYQCKECGATFPTAAGLHCHSNTAHSAPLRKILPKTSSVKGRGPQDSTVSTKVHNQSTQTSGHGKIGRKSTKHSSSSTESGTRKKSKITKKFSCPTCKEAFDSVPNLSAHVFAVHAKLPVS